MSGSTSAATGRSLWNRLGLGGYQRLDGQAGNSMQSTEPVTAANTVVVDDPSLFDDINPLYDRHAYVSRSYAKRWRVGCKVMTAVAGALVFILIAQFFYFTYVVSLDTSSPAPTGDSQLSSGGDVEDASTAAGSADTSAASIPADSLNPYIASNASQPATCDYPSVHSPTGMVSTTHWQATQAGIDILHRGGNAFDAAVAVQMALGVVQPQSTGLGGGCFILFMPVNDSISRSIDGREETPANFDPLSFCIDGECHMDESNENEICSCPNGVHAFNDRVTGGGAVGTPGTLAAAYRLFTEWGSGEVSWSDVLQPAIALARDGFPMYEEMHSRLMLNRRRMLYFPATAELYFSNNNMPIDVNQTFTNTDLANTLEGIAANGIDDFYRGQLAADTVAAVQNAGNPDIAELRGTLSLEDMQDYRAVYRPTVQATYRNYTVHSMNMPSSGGVSLLMMLQMLEQFHMSSIAHNSGEFLHHTIDVQDIVFADRQLYMGDADFIDPMPNIEGLLNKSYAAERAEQYMRALYGARAAAGGPIQPGMPPNRNQNEPQTDQTSAVPPFESGEYQMPAAPAEPASENAPDNDYAATVPTDDSAHDAAKAPIGENAEQSNDNAEGQTPDQPAPEQTEDADQQNNDDAQQDQPDTAEGSDSVANLPLHRSHAHAHQQRYASSTEYERPGTTHFTVADKDGNVVSWTTTIEENFGSGVVVPGRGFLLNNELTDFSATPFDDATGKLLANGPPVRTNNRRLRRSAIGPGDAETYGYKRPMSSMTPIIVTQPLSVILAEQAAAEAAADPTSSTIIEKHSAAGDMAITQNITPKAWLAMGSPGGYMIVGTVLNALLGVLDYGQCLGDAVAAPRALSFNNAQTMLELDFFTQPQYAEAIQLLQSRGFDLIELKTARPLGYVEALTVVNGKYEGVADQRLGSARAIGA